MSDGVIASKISLLRLSGREEKIETDLVAKEVPVAIEVNGKRLITLLATPTDLKELACGFLFSQGLIRRVEEIVSIRQRGRQIRIEATITGSASPEEGVLTSSCGQQILPFGSIHGKKVKSDLCILQDSISSLMREFGQMSNGFKSTGGLHSAGLSDGKKILDLKEDIGRHNTIDKIIGGCLLKGISLEDKALLTSGRVSSDTVVKAVRINVPIIISKAPPTDLAIELAQKSGLTLVGFARGEGMNIYTHPRRVKRR